MFVIAHLSDLHVNGTHHNRARIEAAFEYVNSRADGIDALLVTGDLTDHGSADEMLEARKLITSPLPMLVTIGNHDARPSFNAAFRPDAEPTAPVNEALTVGDVTLLSVDSSLPGERRGFLDDETIGWLDEQLAGAGDRVVVAFHHPPVTLGMPMMDSIMQSSPERLGAVVDAHPNIVALVCGHAHSAAVTTFHGRPLCLAPGVSSTLNLPFEGSSVVNRDQPAGVAFHLIDDDGRVITHFRAIP
ncbi:putative phosphodiesterase [Gordonia araii NBRC 100433]|uniref:Putative phosphodiesterase n=1 Tax=Gordonia araii NBRC 100433 TaxID=1073574 RepID=G7H692_9ACTN|nr:metallophosphoesterase [Gordonia araii]NNG96048.1 metallophosphoesterase [Gordonia araii NBRC 100433]GAB11367.1 putative phosphodiesterase [Gordonia araii NBRC 100433]